MVPSLVRSINAWRVRNSGLKFHRTIEKLITDVCVCVAPFLAIFLPTSAKIFYCEIPMYLYACTCFIWAEHEYAYTFIGYTRTDFQLINAPIVAIHMYAYITTFLWSSHQPDYTRNLYICNDLLLVNFLVFDLHMTIYMHILVIYCMESSKRIYGT